MINKGLNCFIGFLTIIIWLLSRKTTLQDQVLIVNTGYKHFNESVTYPLVGKESVQQWDVPQTDPVWFCFFVHNIPYMRTIICGYCDSSKIQHSNTAMNIAMKYIDIAWFEILLLSTGTGTMM